MSSYIYRTNLVSAIQIPDNEKIQFALAEMYHGSVRGTSLQPIDRVIEFRDMNGDEIEGKVGDWIVINDDIKIQIWEDDAFKKVFVRTLPSPYV
jgi:hypothetical protein